MARNKGKRPGTASESTSQKDGRPSDAAPKASPGADVNKPVGSAPPRQTAAAASSALAAKIGTPSSAAGSSAASDKTTTTPASSGTSRATVQASPSAPAPNSGVKRPAGAQPSKPPSSKSPSTPSPATSSSTSAKASSDPPHGHGSGGSNGSSFWPGVFGGLIGGAATALAASLFWTGGDDGVNQLRSTTADLESRLTATESQTAEVNALAERVAAVEAAPAAGDNNDLTARLDDLEQQLASVGQAAEQAASAADGSTPDGSGIETLSERLTAAEQQLAGLADIEQQLTGLSAEIEAAAGAGQSTAAAMTALQAALPKLEETLAATGTTVEETGQQAAALTESVETMGQTAERLGGDVAALTERVGETEEQLAFIGGEYQRAAAMVVTIGDIDRAIARGEPFASPLDSLKALGQNDAELSDTLTSLEPMAADGAPTRQALKESFGAVASRILLAEKGDTSLTEQVTDNVFGIINMRPAGAEVEGFDARAIVARAQAKLSGNDLAAAIDELGALEGGAAEAAGDWIAEANHRLTAEAAVAGLRAHAQSLLAKGS